MKKFCKTGGFLLASTLFLFFLSAAYQPVTRTTRHILPGTEFENTITVFDTHKDGPCIFIIGGVHGDEEAGWKAASLLASSCPIKNGKLYILPVANLYGAAHTQRYMETKEDLNRSFPGDPAGTPALKTAAAIFQSISSAEPVLVLDLHEAVRSTGDGGSGYSVIYTDFDTCSPYLLPFLEGGNASLNTAVPYGITGPAVPGSLNRTVSDTLKIPVFTVETCRDLPLEERIQEQLTLVSYFLQLAGAI